MSNAEDSPSDDNEPEGPEVIKKLRTSTKAKFTRLLATISAHMEGDGEQSVLKVHRANLNDLYNECIRLHTAYTEKIRPADEDLAKSTKWCEDLDKIYRDSSAKMEEFSKRKEDDGPLNRSVREIEADLRARKRKVEAELEDSQIAEERRVADIRRKAAREEREVELELAAARAIEKNQRQHSTPLKNTGGLTFPSEFHPGDQSTIQKQKDGPDIVDVSKNLALDDWIYMLKINNLHNITHCIE
jgi:hypothetical protein